MEPSATPYPASFVEDVKHALRHWHEKLTAAPPLAALNIFQQELPAAEGDAHRAMNTVLYHGVTAMRRHFPREAELLEWRYLDGQSVAYVANRRNVAESTIYVQQRDAINRLCAALYDLETAAIAAKTAQLAARVHLAPQGHIIGQAEAIQQLVDLVGAPGEPWLVAIDGIGGIGKTTLANAVMQQLVRRPSVQAVAWVSAQPAIFDFGGAIRHRQDAVQSVDGVVLELLRQIAPEQAALPGMDGRRAAPMLAKLLTQRPHLVVVDNLETVEDLERLLPVLQSWTNPSKVIVTTRKVIHTDAGLFHVPVQELSQPDALTLLRDVAAQSNLTDLIAAPDSALLPIYTAVGGNPLALRLVVGQLHAYGLHDILADLPAARGESIENLYTYIYRRAWDGLDDPGRRVLLAMPLVQVNGEGLDFIQAVSGLDAPDVRHGLETLIRANLVNVLGGLDGRRYGIHSLTRVFLQEQVARWQ